MAEVTSFTPVAFLMGETLVGSPPAEGKHLELIFHSLGKNCCQQFATTRKSFMEDEHYFERLPKAPHTNLRMGCSSLMRTR